MKMLKKCLHFYNQSQVEHVKSEHAGDLNKMYSCGASGTVLYLILGFFLTVEIFSFINIIPLRLKHKKDQNTCVECSSRKTRMSFWTQCETLCFIQWSEHRPTSVNNLRIIEDTSLGLLVDILFEDVGKNQTTEGLGNTSLLLFSATLMSQTRLCPAIQTHFNWAHCKFPALKTKTK